MKNLTFTLVLFTALLVPALVRADNDTPTDVATFLERSDECEHWAGEEPYDAARRKEIEQAVKKLKCETVDDDRGALLKKYKDTPSVTTLLNNSAEGS